MTPIRGLCRLPVVGDRARPPPTRRCHPAPPDQSTPGNGWDSSRRLTTRHRTVPCARALLHKARAAEGRRAAASWMELAAQYRTGPRCPSVSQAGTHRWAEGAQTDAASGTQRLNNRLLRQQAVVATRLLASLCGLRVKSVLEGRGEGVVGRRFQRQRWNRG